MDAALSLTGLIEEFEVLITDGDFEGAEELMVRAMDSSPQLEAFFHFQFGRLYSKWNKLSSAQNHLLKAAELAHSRGDELFKIQVVSELKSVKDRAAGQKP